jgi:hypothetical protein
MMIDWHVLEIVWNGVSKIVSTLEAALDKVEDRWHRRPSPAVPDADSWDAMSQAHRARTLAALITAKPAFMTLSPATLRALDASARHMAGVTAQAFRGGPAPAGTVKSAVDAYAAIAGRWRNNQAGLSARQQNLRDTHMAYLRTSQAALVRDLGRPHVAVDGDAVTTYRNGTRTVHGRFVDPAFIRNFLRELK